MSCSSCGGKRETMMVASNGINLPEALPVPEADATTEIIYYTGDNIIRDAVEVPSKARYTSAPLIRAFRVDVPTLLKRLDTRGDMLFLDYVAYEQWLNVDHGITPELVAKMKEESQAKAEKKANEVTWGVDDETPVLDSLPDTDTDNLKDSDGDSDGDSDAPALDGHGAGDAAQIAEAMEAELAKFSGSTVPSIETPIGPSDEGTEKAAKEDAPEVSTPEGTTTEIEVTDSKGAKKKTQQGGKPAAKKKKTAKRKAADKS